MTLPIIVGARQLPPGTGDDDDETDYCWQKDLLRQSQLQSQSSICAVRAYCLEKSTCDTRENAFRRGVYSWEILKLARLSERC